MAKVVKTVFACDICGKYYFSEKEFNLCKEKCKRLKEIEAFDEKWTEDNPPKFKVGDVVEIVNMRKYSYQHYYFVVKEVFKPKYIQCWYYGGEVGSCYNNDYNPFTTDRVEENDLILVMPCEEYNKKVKELMDTYKCKYESYVRFCRDRCAFQVIVPCNIGEEE